MNDLAFINCLAETTYQGPFPSMSKLVVLTPSRPPPLPSSIPTRCMGTSFMKVLNVITQKQAALTTAPVRGELSCVILVRDSAIHSTHSQTFISGFPLHKFSIAMSILCTYVVNLVSLLVAWAERHMPLNLNK